MGTGKTTIAVAAAYLAGCQRVAVLCPPHLTRKWQREIEATLPGAHTVIAKSISDLMRLPTLAGRPLYVVISREQAKLSYRWMAAVVERPLVQDGCVLLDEDGLPIRQARCPACFLPALDKDGLPLEREQLERKKQP